MLRVIVFTALIGVIAGCQTRPHTALSDQTAQSGGMQSNIARITDVTAYALALTVSPETQSIAGHNAITVTAKNDTNRLEFKLDPQLTVFNIQQQQKPLRFEHVDNIINIVLPQTLTRGQSTTVDIYYGGKPHVAKAPPWDGGFVWEKTDTGIDWIGTAVQGMGCDLWWPCKDHFLDKPNTMQISITVPEHLVAVANGLLISTQPAEPGQVTYTWHNSSPLSDYNVSISIGPYQKIEKSYTSINGRQVPLQFWTLASSQKKAQAFIEHDLWQQLAFFEHLLGPYPWYKDKIGFVETPYLGMEHQSVNAYGNEYKTGRHGFDWLAHHELAHEWFGNLLTHKNSQSAWLHEGFAMYMQPVYAQHLSGESYYQHFMYDLYLNISNCKPVIMAEDQFIGDAFHKDIYFKGAWVLHTLRWLMGDETFWKVIRVMLYNTEHPVAASENISPLYRSNEDFFNLVHQLSGKDYQWLFDAYLKHETLPALEVLPHPDGKRLRWKTGEPNRPFPMPVPLSINGKISIIPMDNGQHVLKLKASDNLLIDPNMRILRQLPIQSTCGEDLRDRSRF